MKASPLITAVTLAILSFASSLVDAHTHLSSIQIDGTKQGSSCIKPLIPATAGNVQGNRNAPITDVNSKEMTCGHLPQASGNANRTCKAHAQSSIKFIWNSDHSGVGDGIDESHKGPIMVYMAPLSSQGNGPVWFKVFEQGFNPSTKTWAVDNMIANKGSMTIQLPKNIPSGKYLVRTEIIALHSAMKIGDAQFYVNCAQVNYSGGQGTKMPAGVSLPGAYKATDPGILFNLYTPPPKSYTIPGPRVTVQ